MILDNQTVSIKRVTGWDKFKEPLTWDVFPVSARVVAETQRVMNPAGEEVITSYSIVIKRAVLSASGAQTVKYNDEIVYVDEDGNPHSRKPQSIGATPGFGGKSFFVRVAV